MIRLLHCGYWAIEEHNEENDTPNYAILSHTWELPYPNGDAKEVNYRDIKERLLLANPSHRPTTTAERKELGWKKVEDARKEAWDLGFAWIWIDSCCINVDDVQEHTEAINSMYQWYQNAQCCLAHLNDLQGQIIGRCRWFYRGWTLQELIAPPTVFFYNERWEYCGSRNGRPRSEHEPNGTEKGYAYKKEEDLSDKIAKITSIDQDLLRSNDAQRIKRALSAIPACQKMHWAWERKTTRSEDMAYCLIGIFDINHFYLKRGEREGAFIRLQEEIIKQSSDPTLFAWRSINPERCVPSNRLKAAHLRQTNSPFEFTEALHGIFACHPSEFQHAGDIRLTQHIMYNEEITVASKGVKFIAPLWGGGPESTFIMSINSVDGKSGSHLGIQLRWIGGNVYARTKVHELTILDVGEAIPSQDDVYITRKIYHVQDCLKDLRKNAIRVPQYIQDDNIRLERESVSPGVFWSESLQAFMTSGTKLPVGCATYLRDDRAEAYTLLFGLSYTEEPWSCLITPESPLAPSHSELRRAYIERIWRQAFQSAFRPKEAWVEISRLGITYRVKSTLTPGQESFFILDIKAHRVSPTEGGDPSEFAESTDEEMNMEEDRAKLLKPRPSGITPAMHWQGRQKRKERLQLEESRMLRE